MHESADNYEQALAAALHSLTLQPYFRPGIQSVAYNLVLLGRDAEALAVLNDAVKQIESCWLVAQLAQLQTELGLYAEARASFDRFADFAPLLDKNTEQWLFGNLADAAYLCGDRESALLYVKLSESPFHQIVAEQMQAANETAKRVQLPVGFVRQHHVTCAPATLTFLSNYWQMPADHLSVVEAICYDGTPARSERDWAEKQGWYAREFCVTWEDTVKLIDRGVPFTLTTVDTGNAHLQAVIGYDSYRGTLLVRDPYDRNLGEFAAPQMLERYRSSGPRGMAMVPLAQKHLLADLELCEANLYDSLYQVQQALFSHQRAQAEAAVNLMMQEAATHRLTYQAQLSLAEYDSDDVRVLSCLENLLTLFPEEANWKLYKLSVLRRLARRSERMDLLQSICAERKSHPLFWQMYAEELSDDGRAQAKVLKLIRRALRYGVTDARNYYLLANIFWSQRRFAEAKTLYRYAACLKDTSEGYAQSYFTAAQHFHEEAAAFRFLQNRFERFGKQSGWPVRTLVWAYEQTGQEPAAVKAVETALQRRPDDSALILYAANFFARYGNFETAFTWLQQAENKAHRVEWLQTAALITAYRGDSKQALDLWKQVVAAEPLNFTATSHVVQLLAEIEGEAAALHYLRNLLAQFPHNTAFHRLLVEWLRDDPVAEEKALRTMIEVDATDAWAHRELALVLSKQLRHRDALQAIELAGQLEPAQLGYYNILGKVQAAAGNVSAAKIAYRQALELSIDSDYAIANLMELCHSPAERREVLQFVKDELVRQVTFGDGLLAYREHARDTLAAEELRNLLHEALKARQDLWHAWSALILQFIDMQENDKALALAREATARFPLIPRLWFDLSLVHQVRLERDGEIAALQKALQINPGWGKAVRQLADAYMNSGALQQARATLEIALARSPLEAVNHGYLADVLWRMGEKDNALERVKQAVTLEPDYDWAWGNLRTWAQELKREKEAVAFVREVAQKRSNEARSWLLIARTLNRPEDLPERLRALDQANEINPRLLEAHLLRVKLLTDARRYEEARIACQPPVYQDDLPVRLRSAAAKIEAECGDIKKAIQQIRLVVAEEPNNYEAWSCLADWVRGDELRKGEYLEVAEKLVSLAPNYVVSLGYLGEARKMNGDRAGAKNAYARAITLSPDYDFGAFNLFDLQLEDNEFAAAEETLQILQLHVKGDWVMLRELELAAKQKHVDAATKHFRALCCATETNRSLLDFAVKALDSAGLNTLVDAELDSALAIAQANPNVGTVYADRCAAQKTWKQCRKRLDSIRPKEAVWKKASARYLLKLTEAGRGPEARKYIKQHAALLKTDDEVWSMVGYVWHSQGRHTEAVNWFADWQQRQGVEPWAMWNYALSARSLDFDVEAHNVSRRMMELYPDQSSDDHKVLVAFDEILKGRTEMAAEILRSVNYSMLQEWEGFIYLLTTEVIDYQRAGDDSLLAGYRCIKELGRIITDRPFVRQHSLLMKIAKKTVKSIGRFSNNLALTVWGVIVSECFLWSRYPIR